MKNFIEVTLYSISQAAETKLYIRKNSIYCVKQDGDSIIIYCNGQEKGFSVCESCQDIITQLD